jgi:hypothetical protein
MSIYSGNSCNIITLFPMSVQCSVVNAYSPETNDGGVYLIITGGTPPYQITWTNGSQTQNLIGVGAGQYTATVTDYYNDFSATTTCTVGTTSFYLEEFFNCTEPTNKLYYLANLNFLYPTGDTFTITSQSGCWVSNGLTLYSGQNYYNYTATTTSGPFEDCTECLPVTPEFENTSGLCLNTVGFTFVGFQLTPQVNQYQFFSAGTYNGYPSWTSSTPSQKIYFNTATNNWNVSGWTLSGVPVLGQQISPPIGIWTVNGSSRTVNVLQGNCGTNIIASIQKTNPTCNASANGTIKVNNVAGGTAPYTYSLDNITYQNSNIFNNLSTGNYTVYIKDVIGNIATLGSVLTPQQSTTTYQVDLSFVPSNPTSTSTTNSVQKTANWVISVTPTLPANRVVNMTIYNTTSMSAGTANNGSPTLTYSNVTGTTGTAQFLTSNTQTITNSYPNTVACHPNFYTTGITRTYTVSISGTGTVTGTIFQKVQVVNSGQGCVTKGTIGDTISIGNIVLLNQQTCETISNNVIPISVSVNKEGTLGFSQNNLGG